MQLWLIPRNERLAGINEHFKRGHTGTVIVISEDDFDSLSFHIDSVDRDKLDSMVLIFAGSAAAGEQAQRYLQDYLKMDVALHDSTHINDTITVLGSNLMAQYHNQYCNPVIIRLDPGDCPEYHYVPGQGYLPECSPDDIESIRDIAERIGATVKGDQAIIDLDIGRFAVDIKTGAVSLSPLLCNHCSRDCKRNSHICIVSVDEGWSSEEIGNRALLVIAKIWALANSELPDHVQKQIRMSSQCKNYKRDESVVDDKSLTLLGYRSKEKRRPLLEEAGERLSVQKLTASAYELLKNKWQHVRGQSTEYDE